MVTLVVEQPIVGKRNYENQNELRANTSSAMHNHRSLFRYDCVHDRENSGAQYEGGGRDYGRYPTEYSNDSVYD